MPGRGRRGAEEGEKGEEAEEGEEGANKIFWMRKRKGVKSKDVI